MNYFFLALLSISTVFSATSQTKESLAALSFEAIRDSINATMYSDPDTSLRVAEAYIFKAQQENNKEKEFLGLEAIAVNYIARRDYKSANAQALQMLAFARENDLRKEEMRALIFLGDLQVVVTSAQEQLAYYNQLLELAETYKNDEYREIALNKIANIMDISGETQKAVAIRKKTIAYYKNKPIDTSFTQKDQNSALIRSYNLLGASYILAQQIDSAKISAMSTKDLVSKELDSCYATFHYTLEGEIAFEEKRFNDAKNIYNTAYDICPSDYDIVALNRAYTFGKIEVGAENYNEAIRILQQGLDSYQVTEVEEGFMKDYYERLAEAYKHTGDFERASHYFEKYWDSQEEYKKLEDNAKQVILAEERAAFKKEFDELKAAKEQGQSKIQYILLGASLVILVLLFLLLKFYRNKKRNEAKFEALLAKIEAAQSPEEIIDTKDEILEEKSGQDVSEEIKNQILEGLKKLEEKEYYLQTECNSYNVAKKIGTNTSYLSKVINSHYGKNFNTYINDLRINYAIVRIKNDVLFRSYSIQSIAEEIGYKSADSFTKYFKKDTGLNPSFYIKNIKNIA